MNRDEIVKIKDEPDETKWFSCDFCRLRYRCEKTRNAHQKSYCPQRETRRTRPAGKFSLIDKTFLSNLKYKERSLHIDSVSFCSQIDLSMKRKFNEISRFSTSSKPLDLSKPKKFKQIDTQIYPCRFCSIEFRSSKTLRAHQENYCVKYRKQMSVSEPR